MCSVGGLQIPRNAMLLLPAGLFRFSAVFWTIEQNQSTAYCSGWLWSRGRIEVVQISAAIFPVICEKEVRSVGDFQVFIIYFST